MLRKAKANELDEVVLRDFLESHGEEEWNK